MLVYRLPLQEIQQGFRLVDPVRGRQEVAVEHQQISVLSRIAGTALGFQRVQLNSAALAFMVNGACRLIACRSEQSSPNIAREALHG